jgi:hypothetical protein
MTEAYGFAYQSPFMLWQLVPPRSYYPLLLVNDSPSAIKDDVVNHTKQHGGSKRLPVVLAGSLDILQSFLKQFPKQDCKVILFDCPCFLEPFFGPKLQWLDCDHQAGGAWQTAKIKPEDFTSLLEDLSVLSKDGREFFLTMKRHVAKDRVKELEAFAKHMPKYYKELVVTLDQEINKSPLKIAKEARKTKDTLKNLLHLSLEAVTELPMRQSLVTLVLGYQTETVAKREYLTKLSTIVSNEFVKKEFLNLRKWMDAKAGALLKDAYFDFVVNHERRSWQTLVETHKKVAEEDLLLLLSHSDFKESLQKVGERLSSFQSMQSDKAPPVRPNHPELIVLSDIFNY